MKKIISHINVCNIYIFIWVLYSFHWSDCMVPFIENISNLLLGFNLIISLYYTFITINTYRLPRFFGAIKLLLVIFFIYGIVYILFGPDRFANGRAVGRGTYLVSVLRSFLPIFVFYFFTKKGYLTPNILKFWSIIFLLSYIYIFYLFVLLKGRTIYEASFVNNTGYLFAIAIPCVYYWNKSTLIEFAYIGVCFIFTVLSLKRGAMLIGALVILMFFNYLFKNADFKAKVYIGCISVSALFLAYNFVGDTISESASFQKRISSTMEGNVSHRDVLAHDFVKFFFNDADVFQFFLGSGADATLSVSDNYAHNDWLEILIDQGILGILVYSYFWICFYRQWRRTKKDVPRQIIGSYFIIYLLRSFFSMGYSMFFPVASLGIGYAIAESQNKKISS